MAPEDENEGEGQDPRQKLYQQRLAQMQMEMKKKELLRRMLSETAYARMTNVKLSSPELYEKVVQSLAYVAQSGKAMGRISDEQLHSLLAKMIEKKDTTIEFKRK